MQNKHKNRGWSKEIMALKGKQGEFSLKIDLHFTLKLYIILENLQIDNGIFDAVWIFRRAVF